MIKWGLRLKSLREVRKLSQIELAADCNLEQSVIAKLESGKRKFSLGLIEKLSHGLGLSKVELIAFFEEFEFDDQDRLINTILNKYIALSHYAQEILQLGNELSALRERELANSQLTRELDLRFIANSISCKEAD